MRAGRKQFGGWARVLMGGYSALLGAGLVVSAPWWLTRMVATERYRAGLRERLGLVPRRLRAAVASKRVVWVHAVSVGEVLAVSRLVHDLQGALNGTPEQGKEGAWIVVVSTTTRTGQALARERFGAERVFYFPLDFAFAVRAFLNVLKPAMVLLAESEIWPRLLTECERRDIPVVVVNARVSDRSFRRALRVRLLWQPMLRKVRLWLAQSREDAGRLLALGAPPKAVEVSGNLKYDVRPPKISHVVSAIAQAVHGRQVIVAGSTVAGRRKTDVSEDSPLIRAWDGTLRDWGVVLVLAPRHPENFDYVYSMAIEYPTLRASELLGNFTQRFANSRENERHPVEIIVLDTIGDLAALYQLADVAFVGGSLVPAGGHNPLEPAQFGVPVIMGPSFENFRSVVHTMQAAQAISIVRDTEELQATLTHLLDHPEAARAGGQRGKTVFEAEGGATARTLAALQTLLPATATSEAVPA